MKWLVVKQQMSQDVSPLQPHTFRAQLVSTYHHRRTECADWKQMDSIARRHFSKKASCAPLPYMACLSSSTKDIASPSSRFRTESLCLTSLVFFHKANIQSQF